MILQNVQITHRANRNPNGVGGGDSRFLYYSKGPKFKYEFGSYKLGDGWAVETNEERAMWKKWRITELQETALELRKLINKKKPKSIRRNRQGIKSLETGLNL